MIGQDNSLAFIEVLMQARNEAVAFSAFRLDRSSIAYIAFQPKYGFSPSQLEKKGRKPTAKFSAGEPDFNVYTEKIFDRRYPQSSAPKRAPL